jgi:hypothetical protein
LIPSSEEAFGRVRGVGVLEVIAQHPSGSVKDLDLGGGLYRPINNGIGAVKNVRFHRYQAAFSSR